MGLKQKKCASRRRILAAVLKYKDGEEERDKVLLLLSSRFDECDAVLLVSSLIYRPRSLCVPFFVCFFVVKSVVRG